MNESPVEALNKLRAGREAVKKPGEVTFALEGVPTPVQVVWDALDTPDIQTLLGATDEELQKLGINAEQYATFKAEHEEIRKNLAIASSFTKRGQQPIKMLRRIEEIYPNFLKTVTDFGIEIKPRVRTPKSQRSSTIPTPTEASSAPAETQPTAPAPEDTPALKQEVVEVPPEKFDEAQPSSKRPEPVPSRTIEVESSRVHVSASPNSFGELQTLDFTPLGLDQILTDPTGAGPHKLKERIVVGMKAALHGLPMKKSLEKVIPAYGPADKMKKWLAFTVIEMNAGTGRIRVEDIKEYVEYLRELDSAVRDLPEETRARLTETKEKPVVAPTVEQTLSPADAENALRDSLLKRLEACRDRANRVLSKRGRSQPADRAVFEHMVIQVRESIWRNFARDKNDMTARADVAGIEELLNRWDKETTTTDEVVPPTPGSPEDLRNRLDATLARVRTAMKAAHQGNPAAVVDIRGTKEFFAAYNASKFLLDSHEVGHLNGTPDEAAVLPTVTTGIEELERMSKEIAQSVASKETTPQTTATKPVEAVPSAPKINIVIETPASTVAPKSPERAAELGALKEKRDAYLTAKAAYEKAIDAHYGAYRSNTGPFAERLGRGMRKLFGMGPKHASLEPLYTAMNNARVDYSKTRFGMMDARINRMYNKNGSQSAEKVTGWHDQLKRREITRTIQRSSEGFVERQYKALSPQQQNAVDALQGRTENDIAKSERRMTYMQMGLGVVSAGLMVWKANTVVATGGTSLAAGYLALVAGNTAGNVVGWWKDRRLGKLRDELKYVSDVRAERVDFDTDATADYDKTLRDYGTKIIATEESRNAQVKVARAAGAVGAGLLTGTIAEGIDFGDKNIDARVVPSPEPPLTGNFEAPAQEGTGMYQFVKNDNPWDIVEEKHFSEKFDDMSKTERDVVIDSAVDRLRADEALRERIFPGYNGTTFTDMQIGQDVNLVEYEKLIDEQLEKAGHTSEAPAAPSEPEKEIPAKPEVETSDESEDFITHVENPSVEEQVKALNDPSIMTEPEAHSENAEVQVSASEIAKEKANLYAALQDIPKSNGIFSSIFGGGGTTAHEFLANQSLAEVTALAAQRPEYIAMIANQNGVNETALQNWTSYIKQLNQDIANRSPQMTLGSYVNDNVLPELAKQAKRAS